MRFIVRLTIILAAGALAPVLLYGQAPAPAPPAKGIGPRIQFNTETYDAGTNLAGEKILYTFIVTNTGDESLVLTNVKPSCGCTTIGGIIPGTATSSGGTGQYTSTWTHEIAPGQIGIIPLQIVLADSLRGPVRKTVTVTSNDRTRPNVILNIATTVWMPVEVSPPNVSFYLMPDVTNRTTQVVRILNRTEAPLSVWNPSCTTNAFSLELKTNVPGQEYEMTVIADPPSRLQSSLSSSVIQGEITLNTSVSNRNPLKIPVTEVIQPEIMVFPAVIQVPAGPLTQPSTSHVTIRDNVASLLLSDPAVNVPGSSVSITVVQTNRQYFLNVVFPSGFDGREAKGLELTMKTDNPRFPTLTIPVLPLANMPNVRLAPAGAPSRTALVPTSPGRVIVPAPGLAAALPRTNATVPVSVKNNSPPP